MHTEDIAVRVSTPASLATRVFIPVIALVLVSCDEPTDPDSTLLRREQNAQAVASQPFYYYEDEKIFLDRDIDVLVIGSRDPVVRLSPSQALMALGARVIRVQALDHVPDHWVVQLQRPASVSEAMELLERLNADARFEFVSSGFHLAGKTNRMLPVNRVGVRFKPGVERKVIDSLVGSKGGTVLREARPDSGFMEYWISYPPGAPDPLAIAAAYDQHPLVLYAHPDMINEIVQHFVPSDAFYSLQYYLKNPNTLFGVRVDIDVEQAWDIEPTKGCGIPSLGCNTVAVIDDGVQSAHPDLNGRVSQGYDVFSGDVGAANDPTNDPSHGTLVAGLIVGQHDGQGIAGIAPGAYVLPIRIFRPLTEGLPATDLQVADGINVAWMMGAKVLNNSWGWPPGYPGNNAVTTAVNSATTQGRSGLGAVVVFAGGNNSDRQNNHIGIVSYPGNLPNVLTVGAINRFGAVTNYSPEGNELDVVAPSGHFTDPCIGDVVTTDLVGARGCNDGPNGNIDYSSTFSGTSAAAPQVASIATLLMAKEPSLSESAIRSRIKGAADPWGPSFRFGTGKLNAVRTLTVPPLSVWISGPYSADPNTTCSWIANVSGGVQPYSFSWRVDGSPVGTNSSELYFTNWGSSFGLEVTVTDASSGSQSDSRSISVYSGAGTCPF